MSSNFFATVDDPVNLVERKYARIVLCKLCKIARRFAQQYGKWAISFCVDAMANRTTGFVLLLTNVCGLLRSGKNGNGKQGDAKHDSR